MKRFTRKISAVLIAILLFMTVTPNVAYANDDIELTPQAEVVAETELATEESTPGPEAAPATDPEFTPEAEGTTEPELTTEDIQEPESIQSSEQIPAIETEPEPENTTGGVIGGDATLKKEVVVPGTNYKADEVLLTPENLTVLLRGLSDSNKENTMLIINEHINNVVLQQGLPMNITGASFVDAEKFSTGTPGFDSQHCWAATASNVLWTTGYAQQAINPQTGRNFASEDEVLAYFTANFTDLPGDPEDGVNWFMKGTGAYSESQRLDGVAHYTDASSGGLLPSVVASSAIVELWNGLWRVGNPDLNKGTPDTINSLLSVCSQGMGVLVKWYENGNISPSAHWMTVVGTVIDRAANVPADMYKALILADSDSDPVHREAGVNLGATTPEQKLAEKANSVNAYTVYKLEFRPELNGNGAWRLVGFGESASRMAVVSHLYYLLDSDKSPQGAPGNPFDRDQIRNKNGFEYSTEGIFTVNAENSTPQSGSCQTPVVQENNDTIVITDGQNAIVIAKEDILNALTEAELDKSENLANLLEYMNDNKVDIFPRLKGIVSVASGDNYVAYIKTPNAAKLTVSVDGIVLPEDAYEIIVLPNGMIKLRIKGIYLKNLSLGKHSLQIIAEESGSMFNSIVNVIE